MEGRKQMFFTLCNAFDKWGLLGIVHFLPGGAKSARNSLLKWNGLCHSERTQLELQSQVHDFSVRNHVLSTKSHLLWSLPLRTR